MTTAKITAKGGYRCAPNGWRVEYYPFGTIVTGQIAKWALDERAAQRMFDPREEAKVDGPDELKAAPKKRGRPKKEV